MIPLLLDQIAGAGALGLRFLDPWLYVLLLVALVIGITVHEFGHAWMADRLGDPGPRASGRVTLSPLAHLDPLGTLLLAVTTLVGFPLGWGRPVRTDPDSYHVGRRAGVGLVAAAGPLMNLITAILLSPLARWALEALRSGRGTELTGFVFAATVVVMLVNLSLFCFNLVPVHPLDGSHIAASLLPQRASRLYQRFMGRYGVFVLLALLVSGVLGKMIGPLVLTIFRRLIGL